MLYMTIFNAIQYSIAMLINEGTMLNYEQTAILDDAKITVGYYKNGNFIKLPRIH